MGAAPPNMAKAASVRQRPGCDQAQSTLAATIGPTPQRVSRSGRQARTRTVMARVCSAISTSRSWMRRPGRRLAVFAVSRCPGGRSALPAGRHHWRVVRPCSRPGRIGRSDDRRAVGCASVWPGRRGASGQPHRHAVRGTAARAGQAVTAKRLRAPWGVVGRIGAVARVAAWAVPGHHRRHGLRNRVSRPVPPCLRHARPQPAGGTPLEQLLVAAGVTGRRLARTAQVRRHQRGGVGVLVGSTPMPSLMPPC